MVMPGGVSGCQLAERLLAIEPSLKVIYTSGYSPGMVKKDHALLEGKTSWRLYRPTKLLQTVRSSAGSRRSVKNVETRVARRAGA